MKYTEEKLTDKELLELIEKNDLGHTNGSPLMGNYAFYQGAKWYKNKMDDPIYLKSIK